MNKSNFLFVSLCILVFSFGVHSQDKKSGKSKFNAELAKKLGADQYGMKSYVLINLKTGPADAEIKDEEERKKIFAGHFANMGRLAKEGKLVLAGPYMDSKPYRGLFIFNVKTVKEAVDLVLTDPGVKAGVFVYEAKKLYSSAALMMINETHEKLQKSPI